MVQDELQSVCENVLLAVKDVKAVFNPRAPREDILNAFWCLQDRVHQLSDYAQDHPDALDLIHRIDPKLIQSVLDVLTHASRLALGKIAAVEQACASINKELFDMQRQKDQLRYRAATAGA